MHANTCTTAAPASAPLADLPAPGAIAMPDTVAPRPCLDLDAVESLYLMVGKAAAICDLVEHMQGMGEGPALALWTAREQLEAAEGILLAAMAGKGAAA